MKKVLFASVALAAMGVAAQAAEPIKLSIGGYANQWAGYAGNKENVTGEGKLDKFDVQDDVQINFTGATKLDNGISVSVEVDTMGTQGTNSHTAAGSNKNVKKSFVAVGTAFGAVEVGEQDNVGALIHVSSPNVDAIGGQDGNWMNWIVAPTGFNETFQRTYAGDDRSANKIIYVSPSFYGLAAGFSYTPSINPATTGHTSIQPSGEATTSSGDLYVYGLAYANTFGDVSVKADAGSGNANIDSLHVYQGGLNVGYKGFTVGGSILKRDVRTGTGHNGLGGENWQIAAIAKEGVSWDAGASYVNGPYGVSLSYFHGTAQGNLAAGEYDRDGAWDLGGSYDLGPGVKLTESLLYVNYNSAVAPKNNGYGAITGINVTF